MSTTTKATPEFTRAAERYLEQCGDPLVMNTYLKIAILVLAVVTQALAALVFRSQKALASMKPLIIRISDVGHAEAIDYSNFKYRPQEAENKYYLTRWAELYFSRNRFTIERDQTRALLPRWPGATRRDRPGPQRQCHPELQDQHLAALRRCEDQKRPSGRPSAVAVFGAHRVREGLHQPPDQTGIRREQWTASVTYAVFSGDPRPVRAR